LHTKKPDTTPFNGQNNMKMRLHGKKPFFARKAVNQASLETEVKGSLLVAF